MSAQDDAHHAKDLLAKRKDLYEEAMWRSWLAVRKRVLKREGKCASGCCQARREALVRYLEKKTRREFKNLFKGAAVRLDDAMDC